MTEAATTPAEQAALQLRRAKALFDISRHQDAIALLTDSLRLNPECAETYCYLGWALQRTGDYERSLSVLDEAIKLQPNSEWPHRLQSIAYKEQGHLDAALEKAREAQRLAPDAWETSHTLAEALLMGGQLAKAQEAAHRLRELAPGNSSTFSVLGRIALGRRQLLRAERHFREALRLDPQSANAHNNIGSALLEQGRVKEAVTYFDSALTINPTAKVTQSNLYLGARKLRDQSWLATSRGLLTRISPKVYNYYLHREQSSFRIFFFVFAWKLALPLAACFTLLGFGIRWLTGSVDVSGVVLGGLGLTAFFLVIARLGWASRYFEASTSQVQIITTLSAWLFSPLALLVIGVAGLMLDSDAWVIYLLVTITGATFGIRQLARNTRSVFYRVASRFFRA